MYAFSASSVFNQIPHHFRRRIMAQSAGNNNGKKLIKIDISSDTVCPWCFVGKKHLDKAIDSVKDQFDFELSWHPFFLEPSAPKEGVNKKEFYFRKYGPRFEQMTAQMTEIYRGLGYDYTISGLTGNTFDSHRLIYFAGTQGSEKQHAVVEELNIGYFTQAKYIGDREFLLECAQKAGVEGAAEFLENPENGKKEVYDELKQYSSNISGVPHFVINGKFQLSGAQPPASFLSVFQKVASQE
ncbi:transferase [Lithospermum erythrorhizon]|uniref:Transferase n=1 Tax=Lithospermum erythrorhizon TaxID=34254 RepID=A0AAV3RXN8_LITER